MSAAPPVRGSSSTTSRGRSDDTGCHHRRRAARTGLHRHDATIRADAAGGLGYYRATGLVHHETKVAVPLRDGTPVDRISMRRAVG